MWFWFLVLSTFALALIFTVIIDSIEEECKKHKISAKKVELWNNNMKQVNSWFYK